MTTASASTARTGSRGIAITRPQTMNGPLKMTGTKNERLAARYGLLRDGYCLSRSGSWSRRAALAAEGERPGFPRRRGLPRYPEGHWLERLDDVGEIGVD